ncbi:hypothetical protein D3C81_1576230 [compost metagenome]
MTLVSQTLADALPTAENGPDATVIISGTCPSFACILPTVTAPSAPAPGTASGVMGRVRSWPWRKSCNCKVRPGAWLRVAMTAATSCTGWSSMARIWSFFCRPARAAAPSGMISISVGAERARVRPSLPSTSPSRSVSVRLAVGNVASCWPRSGRRTSMRAGCLSSVAWITSQRSSDQLATALPLTVSTVSPLRRPAA